MSRAMEGQGQASSTAHHFIAQSVFPFLVKSPSGKPAVRLPLGETEVLRYCRDYFDENLIYTAISLILGRLSNQVSEGTATLADKKQLEKLMALHKTAGFRLNSLFRSMKPQIDPLLAQSDASYWSRGKWGLEPPDAKMYEWFLLQSSGMIV